MDEDTDGLGIDEEDFYGFLSVPRNASKEDIVNAYRRLSRLYHPDKHTDPVQKKEAEILFNKTKKAYEVLIDPHTRAIYDSLGIRGLQTEGWEIVQRTKTPQEIREEYERLAREREERRLQQETNPKGTITVNINATDVFNRYNVEPASSFANVEVSGMSLSQSIEAPITLKNTIILSGHLNTQNGVGSGSVSVSNRHLYSEKGWVETELAVGNGPVLAIKGSRTLSKRMFCNGSTTFQFSSLGIRPGLVGTVAMQLDKHILGYLTWRAGAQSSMSTVIVRDTPTSHTSVTFQIGIPHSFLSLSYTYKFEVREMKLRSALKIGTFGAVLEYGTEKRVSQHSTLGATVAVGVPTGVVLKLKIIRASQTYSFPIHMSEEIVPSVVFYATVAPVITWFVVKKFIIDPIVQEQKERDKERQREANKSRLAEKKREAKSAVSLMRATFARIRSSEETKKGLVIVKALYGRILSVSKASGENTTDERQDDDEEEVIDVTIPLQCLVKDSKLVLHESSKSTLAGFYDPCLGEDKALYVQYLFHSQVHEVTVADNELLRIPKQSHRVNPV